MSNNSKISKERLLQIIMRRIAKRDNGCWEWTGAKIPNSNGKDIRPTMTINKRRVAPHRVMFELHIGPITPDKPWVLHKCDNSLCCNPEHLFAGTVQDNVKDSISKGRFTYQKYPGLHTERARELGKRNTWSKGRKYPNRKRPSTLRNGK